MHQQLWQWGSEWLCSECWNRANESKESEDQPAAKKAKHSSWDWVYVICELIGKQAEWCMHHFTNAHLVLRTCCDKELRQCCESAARVRKSTRDRDTIPDCFFEPPTARIVCRAFMSNSGGKNKKEELTHIGKSLLHLRLARIRSECSERTTFLFAKLVGSKYKAYQTTDMS